MFAAGLTVVAVLHLGCETAINPASPPLPKQTDQITSGHRSKHLSGPQRKQSSGDLISWDQDDKLKWDDFKATPDESSTLHALRVTVISAVTWECDCVRKFSFKGAQGEFDNSRRVVYDPTGR